MEKVAVFTESTSVTNAMRTANVNRLVDGFGTVRFARVNGHVDVVVANELERTAMVLRGVIVFGARKVEADDAAVGSAWSDLSQTITDLPSDVPLADNWETVQAGVDDVQGVYAEMRDGLGCDA